MWLWFLAAVAAFFIKGLCGFANTLVCTSILTFGVNNVSISPVELILGFPTNVILTYKNRSKLKVGTFLPLAIMVLIGSIPGALLLKNVDARLIKIVFGVIIALLGVELYLREINTISSKGSKLMLYVVGVSSGVLCGLFGVGALLAAYISRVTTSSDEFKANISAVFIVDNIFRIILYSVLGIFTFSSLKMAVILIPFALLGLFLGMKSADVLDDKVIKRVVIILLIMSGVIMVAQNIKPKVEDESYGVYIGANPEDMEDRQLPETIVIDAQYYSDSEIAELKDDGHIVYTYLNLGSIESFRDYYAEYESLTLDTYENWEDEKWVDVTDASWQEFLSVKADELIAKGVDGFFIDNTDVYYQYPTEKVFESVSSILKDLQSKDTYVLINGGDSFVREYLNRNGSLGDILDGVNQENVYTAIDWEDDSFTVNPEEEREYFLEYLNLVQADGEDVYALDYATDEDVVNASKSFAKKHGYTVYVSPTLELK